MSPTKAPDGADHVGKGPRVDEDLDAWTARLHEHAQSFGAKQAESPAGRRLIRESIAGKLPRRTLLTEAFGGGYEHGVLAGMTAAKDEIARLQAVIRELLTAERDL